MPDIVLSTHNMQIFYFNIEIFKIYLSMDF